MREIFFIYGLAFLIYSLSISPSTKYKYIRGETKARNFVTGFISFHKCELLSILRRREFYRDIKFRAAAFYIFSQFIMVFRAGKGMVRFARTERVGVCRIFVMKNVKKYRPAERQGLNPSRRVFGKINSLIRGAGALASTVIPG